MSQLRAAFPSGPLLDASGGLHPAWRGFFMSLYARTGDAGGVDVSALTEQVGRLGNGLIAADQALALEIVAETTARQSADASERSAREAADATLQASTLPLTGGTLTGPLAGPAGAFVVVRAGFTTGATWTAGTAVPTSSTEPAGSFYSRTTGGVGTSLYVHQGGGLWAAIA